MAKRLLIVDGSNYLYRGHFAVPNLTALDGTPTGAIKGFLEILLADMRAIDPDYVAIVFDRKAKTFRHEIYPEYKANRNKKPLKKGELSVPQIVYGQKALLRRVLKSLGFVVVQKSGIEGDDIMGCLAVQHAPDMPVYIGSNDKDIAQVVSPRISILDQNRKPQGPKEILAKFGVHPHQIIEYLMLVGDVSDNIPGVKKCGPKTAAKWLSEHGDLKGIRQNQKFTPALGKNFKKAKPFFKLARKLFTMDTDCLKYVRAERLRVQEPNWEEFTEICKAYGLKSLHKTAHSYFKAPKQSSSSRGGGGWHGQTTKKWG